MRQKGFSLSEIIIVAAISSIAITICLSLFKSVSSIAEQTEASAECFNNISCASKKIKTVLSLCMNNSIRIIKSKKIANSYEIYALIPSSLYTERYNKMNFNDRKPYEIVSFYPEQQEGIIYIYESKKRLTEEELQSEEKINSAMESFINDKKNCVCKKIAKGISNLSFHKLSDDSDIVFFNISYSNDAQISSSTEIMNGKNR